MTEEEYRQLCCDLNHEAQRLNDEYIARFKITPQGRWHYDQEAALFVFSADGVPQAVASFQTVGTLHLPTETWMWSWANESIDPERSKAMLVVREFGERHGIEELTKGYFEAQEGDAWAYTSLARQLLNGLGTYRCPSEELYSFVVFTRFWKPVPVSPESTLADRN